MDAKTPIRQCPYCKKEIEPGATTCPHCHRTFVSDNPLKNVIWSVVIFFIMYYLLSAFISCEAKRETKKLYRQAERETERIFQKIEQENGQRFQQKYHVQPR